MKTVEVKTLQRWGADIVGDAAPAQVISIREDHGLVAKVDLFPRDVVVGQDVYRLLGVGGVWTASNRRQRGCATYLITHAEGLARDGQYVGTILFSLENTLRFYERRGYTLHTGPVTMLQAGKPVRIPSHVNVLHNLHGTWVDPDIALEIRGLPW